jgi:hypothetical protein
VKLTADTCNGEPTAAITARRQTHQTGAGRMITPNPALSREIFTRGSLKDRVSMTRGTPLHWRSHEQTISEGRYRVANVRC